MEQTPIQKSVIWQLMDWLKESGMLTDNWQTKLCQDAAEAGKLEVVRWAKSNDAYWDELTFVYGVRSGNLELLSWLHEHGCPWNANCCYYAASMNRLDILEWLISKGCPWNNRTIEAARNGGHEDILKWSEALLAASQ